MRRLPSKPPRRDDDAVALVHFRFYAELNAFLTPCRRQRRFAHSCARDANAKHMIEALGVPHTEVELILASDTPVDFAYRLQEGDRLSVYPHFSSLGPQAFHAAGNIRFIADAHLGRLARDLRMLGFDVLYSNRFADAEVERLAVNEGRIVLSRDRDLLMRKSIVRGCYLHATKVAQQLDEIFRRYGLTEQVRPLSRCLLCNTHLAAVSREEVQDRIPPRSAACDDAFFLCEGCGRVYWNGSHARRMRQWAECLLQRHDSGGMPGSALSLDK